MHVIAVVAILVLLDLVSKYLGQMLQRKESPKVKQEESPMAKLETQLAVLKKELAEVRGIEFIKKQREIQKIEKEMKAVAATPVQNAPLGKTQESFVDRIGIDVPTFYDCT